MRPFKIRIGDRWVGDGEPCFVIAEVGINHNGDLSIAKRLVDAAAEAGADAVKFQKRTLTEVYQHALLDDPRIGEQGLQYIVPILKECELSDADFTELWEYCRARGIMALCTPWDRTSVDFIDRLGTPAFKIGSPDMTNAPLLEYVARKGKPLIVSTGMATEEEINRTIALLKGLEASCVLLHCVSTYPASAEEMNLRLLHSLREWSGWPVGFSSHNLGPTIATAAVAMGACVVERHITLDVQMRGPDHQASLEPDAFAEQVRQIREVERALGVPHRWMTRGEILNRRVLGKSLVAACDIPKGAVIEPQMLVAKSPGLGISPQRVHEVIGHVALRALPKDALISESDFRADGLSEMRRPIDLGVRWGIIARRTDLERILQRFRDPQPDLIEFHVSDRDLDAGIEELPAPRYGQDLVVHAPEYNHDKLIDLCASDEGVRHMSVARIQRAIDLTRELGRSFHGVGPRGPKVIVHVGGMSREDELYDVRAAYDRLGASVDALDVTGVEFLLENLPPYPWFFGGRWLGHVLVDADTTAEFCGHHRVNLCFDTSHAMLACNHTHTALSAYFARVRPFIRHLHVSDGAGVSGEGLQIGEGQINFVELWPGLTETGATLVPEIWHGHHQEGKGFQIALERLTEIAWVTRALAAATAPVTPAGLEDLIVTPSATILDTLRVIDNNKLGTAFVVNTRGVLEAVVTDGDVRRALLRGSGLQTPVTEIATTDFRFAWDDASQDELRDMLSERYRIVPIVDQAHRLSGFASFHSHEFHTVRVPV